MMNGLGTSLCSGLKLGPVPKNIMFSLDAPEPTSTQGLTNQGIEYDIFGKMVFVIN